MITKYIFILHPKYWNLTNNIWLYDVIPSNILKKIKLPVKDKGIDLLLETNEKEYFAIQHKYRSNIFDSVTWENWEHLLGNYL